MGDRNRSTSLRGAAWFHVVVACAVLGLHAGDALPNLFNGDIFRYVAIATGPTFWIDQPVEFPPVTAVFIWLAARWGVGSLLVLPVANLVMDLLTARTIAAVWGPAATARYLVLAGLLLPITLFRVDHLTVLLVVLALAANERDHPVTSGGLLGLGVLGKLWPAAVLAATSRRDTRLLVSGVVVTVVGVVVWAGLYGPTAVEQVLTFRASTGWQIESVPGSLLRLVTGAHAEFQGGAWRAGTAPALGAPVLGTVGLAIFAASRRVPDLGQRRLALVAGLMLVTPLLSPQFLLWLVPLVAVLPVTRWQPAQIRLLFVAILLTLLLALGYLHLVANEPITVAVLFVRNALLFAIMVLALTSRSPTASDASAVPSRTSA